MNVGGRRTECDGLFFCKIESFSARKDSRKGQVPGGQRTPSVSGSAERKQADNRAWLGVQTGFRPRGGQFGF